MSAGVADEGDDKNEDQTEEYSQEDQDNEGEAKSNENIDNQEFREELTLIMNQEETAYQDLKYWKTNNYYDIDSLMGELNS